MTALEALVLSYAASDPRLDVWRRYPDIGEAEDAGTDTFACKQVSAGFAEFARERGWNAIAVLAEGADHPLADDHAWVRINDGSQSYDVDFTVRQYHNLHRAEGGDESVLALPWPLVWTYRGEHPVVGTFAGLSPLSMATTLPH
ncbi:hypothetical protein [Arthrobacter sp. ES1]|uniref:hypothetical protein n=1 Tax=Arthrobacter sp. ES1 TaxID=1897056 RepID=UPI001CFF7FD9|nr:hypothetical protein [Arthrobacter sp. ES1]MCB5280310.1 hypothetical protein [Arthrobacter sp. ES1]